MLFIVSILAEAGVLLLLAKNLNGIKLNDFTSALIVALFVSFLNFTIGAVLRFSMNLVTIWLLAFVVRLVVTALMVKLASKLMERFEVEGWLPAFIIAIALAATSALVENFIG